MASATFILEDTPEARKELSLLLQMEPKSLDKVSRDGLITVAFPELLEDKALHVISSAVANHGFQVSINHSPVEKAEAKQPASKPVSKQGSK